MDATVRLGWMTAVAVVHSASALQLEHAVILDGAKTENRPSIAARLLSEEIAKRCAVQLPIEKDWPRQPVPVIALGTARQLSDRLGSEFLELFSEKQIEPRAEGYRISIRPRRGQTVVWVMGEDKRGVIFGAGRLLRELRIGFDQLELADDFQARSAPRYRLRGHQLGYRPKTNSYDAWDLDQWEQYLRDLVVFGSNAIELIPPRSDDAAWSPHFKRAPLEMMAGMSRLANAYDLDVWIWYPALDKDYSDSTRVARAIEEWAAVFARLPRVDAIFVPGGDPGRTPPKLLLNLLHQQLESLHRFHPSAQMWVSPQSFDREWMDDFLHILNQEQPPWLSGIVYGPQIRMDLADLRRRVPAQYPIRHYPDITHSRQCQYPVPNWDRAYAVTEARECINPRPLSEAAVFRRTQPDTIGFLSYSEGCNDDVNKIIWSSLGWDPDESVIEILRQYSRYFIGASEAESFAQGLLALERNWQGPLAANEGVDVTLRQFQAMEAKARPQTLRNWRFQQALFRAYYDAYTRHRLLEETARENSAMRVLENAAGTGSERAMRGAQEILDPSEFQSGRLWRARILQLGEALFQSIGMQLSVERYQAIAVDRGASLDTLDYPLNNRPWLEEQFDRIRRLPTERERLVHLKQIVHWNDPGPGGFYDDLGNPALQPHLVREPSFEEDPGAYRRPREDFEEDLVPDESDQKSFHARRLSWIDHAEVLYDAPLRMRYTALDPSATYRLRIVYAGDASKKKIRLIAKSGNRSIEMHPYLRRPIPFQPLAFDIPPSATAAGELNLEWTCEPGLGGNGRGCQVSEVWLIREPLQERMKTQQIQVRGTR